MSKTDFFKSAILTVFILAPSSACAPRATPMELIPVTVQLQWTHQAEFAGFYAADQNGNYADEGLAVTFIQGGPDVDNLAPLVDRKVQFCTATAEQLIVARASGKPLRAVATIYRRSPAVFFSLADSGITRPQDFAGKKVRVPATILPTLHAMTSRVGVTPDQYTEVNLPSDVTIFASGVVPVWGGYINALPLLVQKAGIKIIIIYPDDYGVHFYGDSLITTDELISTQPDLVERFLRATLVGWTYAVENPEKVGLMVQKYIPDAEPSLETDKMIASIPLVNTGEDHIGWMKAEMWTSMEQTLREQGVLTSPLDVTQVYTMQFLNEIYR
jgi:NitT/TauT family transport system substrate-binding protein